MVYKSHSKNQKKGTGLAAIRWHPWMLLSEVIPCARLPQLRPLHPLAEGCARACMCLAHWVAVKAAWSSPSATELPLHLCDQACHREPLPSTHATSI